MILETSLFRFVYHSTNINRYNRWNGIKSFFSKFCISSVRFIHFQKTMQLTCRFFKNRLPETDDLVMVNVVNIEEMGVYVHLLEYNNIEGSIHPRFLFIKYFVFFS